MKAPRISWLIGPYADSAFFIAAPLAIVPAYLFLAGFLSLSVFKLGILSISATGHHLPGFIRAYTDRKIFAQFRSRLLIVPALFVLLTLAAAWFRLSVVFFILIVWSTWHGSMQILGFLRIYDAKAGFASPWTARLDWWMCLSWFVQAVLWSVPKKTSVISSFYLAGGPIIPAGAARLFGTGWLALTAAVTGAYLVRLGIDYLRLGYVNPPKLLCMASGLGFWAYCMLAVDNLVVGLILWEIFHDLQYNAFVWNYNRRRVERDLSQSPLERFLFRMDPRRLAIYAACILAYGCIGLLAQDLLNVYGNGTPYGSLLLQIGNVFAASALIHFYLDGFIWKVRDGKVRRDLGVVAVPAARTPGKGDGAEGDGYRERRPLGHWIYVTLFFAACAGLGAAEHRARAADGEGADGARADNLADLVPGSGYANFMRATRLRAEGKGDSAIAYYERAMGVDTEYAFAQVYIGELRFQAGDMRAAEAAYEEAYRRDPRDSVVRGNLAESAFRVAFSLLQAKKGLEAKPHLERSLALDPGRAEAWNYLGMIEQATGNPAKARECYGRSLELDSAYGLARENLSTLGR
ncbi:MAG: yrrB 4 [Fibrobacteres bacterium]|nr:yrrB 4 [Fibrobacterota bacterium]